MDRPGESHVNRPKQSFPEFLLELLYDQNLYLLFDRYQEPTARSRISFLLKNKERCKGMLQYQQQCIDMASSWREHHSSNGTRYMSFRSAPHTWEKYIGARVAQHLGIRCFVTLLSRVPGYVFIGENLGRSPQLIELPPSLEEPAYQKKAKQYIEASTKTYAEFMPDYESRRLVRNKGRYYSFKQHLRQNWTRPSYVINSVRCWNQYSSISRPLEDFHSKKYVAVFPHYQPERTSVPEAYGFAQQQLMLATVRESLPKDIHVLVKEHPATFTNQCQTIGRWPGWYQSINEMPGIHFVNIETDTFELIKNSIATASLSGTVTNESLLRGAPTVVFGVLRGCSTYGQHHFRDQQSLTTFLKQAAEGAFDPEAIRESAIRTILKHESKYAVKYEPWLEFKKQQQRIIERTLAL